MGTVFPAVGTGQCVGVGTVKFPRATIMGAFIVGKAAEDLLFGFPFQNINKGRGLARQPQTLTAHGYSGNRNHTRTERIEYKVLLTRYEGNRRLKREH